MKILFTVHPGAGHLLPMVPLARELGRRGHDVRIGASPAFASAISDVGLVHLPAGMPWLEREAESSLPGFTDADPLTGLATLFGSPSARLAEGVLSMAGDWAPDLVVRDNTELGGWVVATVLGVPLVVFGVIERLPLPAMAAFAGQLDGLRAAYPRLSDADAASTYGDLYLDPTPPALLGADLAPGQMLVRPEMEAGDTERTPDWVAQLGDRPVVYLTLGTVFHRQRTLLAVLLKAVATRDIDVVLTHGGQKPLADLPPNVRSAPYIPQRMLLPLCSAVLCHAGRGTVMGALAHGLPLVLAPMSADQPVTAAACERAGVAVILGTDQLHLPGRTLPVTVPAHLTADAVREGLRAVLNEPAYAIAARAMRDQIAAMPDVGEAARAVEQLGGHA